MKRAAWVAVTLGGVLVVGAPAAAAAISGIWGRDVLPIINPYDEVAVAGNRITWSPGEPVAAIYGQPADGKIRIVFPKDDRLLIPAEDPTLTLYRIDKRQGENPLQARTLWFFANWIAIGGAILALAGATGLVLSRGSAPPQ